MFTGFGNPEKKKLEKLAPPLVFILALFISSCGGKSESGRTEGSFSSGGSNVKAFGLALSGDGSKLYIADNAGSRLLVKDAASMASAGTLMLDQRPRYLQMAPDLDGMVVMYDKYDCLDTDGNQTICQHAALFDFGENDVTMDAIANNTLGNPKTFAYGDKTAYFANGFCEWGADSSSDFGAIYKADFSGGGATATMSLVAGTIGQSYFGSAMSADGTTLFVSRSCCTSVDTSGSCLTKENELHYYNTADDSEAADSPIDLSEFCDGASYMVFDDSRLRLYISCSTSMTVVFAQFAMGKVQMLRSVSTLPDGMASARTANSAFNFTSPMANLALSSDNKYLFVSHQGFNAVSKFDLDSGEINVFETGNYPAGIVEKYPYIYVTNVLDGTISKINYTTAGSSRVGDSITPDF